MRDGGHGGINRFPTWPTYRADHYIRLRKSSIFTSHASFGATYVSWNQPKESWERGAGGERAVGETEGGGNSRKSSPGSKQRSPIRRGFFLFKVGRVSNGRVGSRDPGTQFRDLWSSVRHSPLVRRTNARPPPLPISCRLR